MQGALFSLPQNSAEGEIPMMGVPVSIAEYFHNKPPAEVNGTKITYLRYDGTPTKNIVFYLEQDGSSELKFFEVLDFKSNCKVDGKNIYKRIFITPVMAAVEVTEYATER